MKKRLLLIDLQRLLDRFFDDLASCWRPDGK
jgi:hypothetical protein